jgi:NAD-dependent deacetylase
MAEVGFQAKLDRVVQLIRESKFTTAFTGAGISVESGIPPFRGEGGLWSKYDPRLLDIAYFMENPQESWTVIKEIFYDYFGNALPNPAHHVLASMENNGLLHCTITQNIDNLHQEAGTRKIHEFHGNSKRLVCLACMAHYTADEVSLDHIPPTCRQCGGLLKPDFVFFGEAIPPMPMNAAYEAAFSSDLFLIIGTTGEVMPANQIPLVAKDNGATIVEINPNESLYTSGKITDIFLQGKAGEVMKELGSKLFAAPLDYN